MNTCDVIIPTYNNAAVLVLALQALNQQEVPSNWKIRVLVCDDGSTDNTHETVTGLKCRFEVVWLPGKHQGVAGARNRGVKASSADVLLFLGADIILRPGALAAHVYFHEQHTKKEEGAIGFVVWDPRLCPTPLMQWATHGGPQNDFDELLGQKSADPRVFFYGSHISLKRDSISSELFAESFRGYGHEDTEIGGRLAARGLQLYVLEQAVGLHHHFYSASAFLRRQYAAGKSRHTYAALRGLPAPNTDFKKRHHVQLFLYPLFVSWVLTSIVQMTSRWYATPRLFSHAASYAYRRGVVAGVRQKLRK